MATSCGYEFQLKHFGFADCIAQRFYEPICGTNKVVYLIYRVVVFLYTLAWIIADVLSINQPDYWIFLTNWSEVTGCLYFLLALIVLVFGLTTHSRADHELLWLHKITWVVFETALSAALATDLLFWALLSAGAPTSVLADPFNIHSHAINYLLLFIDLFINNIPIRLLHFIHPMCYGLTYTIFSLVLHGANFNSAIYPVFDWAQAPGLAVGYALGASLIALPACHLIQFGFYHLRACFVRTCCFGENVTPMDDRTIDAMEMAGQTNNGYD